ncbi:MAG: methyl-accepting chemotaxis protein, partial [Syntrophales bacterium]
DLSSSLTAMMSGREMCEATEGLRQIITRVKELDSGARQGTEVLKVILGRIDEMHRPLAGFAKIVRNLRVLCNFIKIESARLVSTDTGFTTLSEDVGKLAGKIEAKSTDLFEQSMRLATRVSENLKRIDQFETSRHGQALHILEGTGHCLNSLTEKHRLSSAAVSDVNARWGRISRAIGEVVSSLQFHDITRQRIEHVKEALAEVTERLAGLQKRRGVQGLKNDRFPDRAGDTGSGASSRSDVIRNAVGTCEVQRAQLEHAGSEAVSAVKRIIASLDDIAEQVGEMCEETRKLVNETDTAGGSFLSSLERGFSLIAQSLAEYDHINDQLSETIDHAAHTIGAMSTFIDEIEKIGIEIRMIALNASIRAAHVGEHGLALGVLADSIQELSAETTHHADAISARLKTVIASAEELASRVSRTRGANDGGREHLEGEIARMIEPLHRIDQSMVTLLTRMSEQGRTLSDAIAETSGGIEVHRQFDQDIRQLNADLGKAVARMRALLPADGHQEETTDWKRLEDRYTMNREREVHRLVMGGAATVPPVGILDSPVSTSSGEKNPPGDGEDGLGDNVELF